MHWKRIMDPGSGLRFRPIVPLALRLIKALPRSSVSDEIVMRMTETARETGETGEIHGMGDMLQGLVAQRRQRAVYHTRPESAALMANLAVQTDRDWSSPEAACEYRMADYACGAGDLLIAAYRRVRELHRQAGGSPEEIHAAMMQKAITAMDILPASTALAAARLDALETDPAQPGGATRFPQPPVRPHREKTGLQQTGPSAQTSPRAGQHRPPGPNGVPEAGPQAHRTGNRSPGAADVPARVPGPGDHEPALHPITGPRGVGPEHPQPGAGNTFDQGHGA